MLLARGTNEMYIRAISWCNRQLTPTIEMAPFPSVCECVCVRARACVSVQLIAKEYTDYRAA